MMNNFKHKRPFVDTIEQNKEFFEQLLTMLANQLGFDSEIVLHNLTGDYDHTIIAIRNGFITGRKVGDCGTNLGLEVLKGTIGDKYNYITHTKDGKILRSSSMYIKNSESKVIGALCVNTDVTPYAQVIEKLKQFTLGQEDQVEEFFNGNIRDLLDDLINKAIDSVNMSVDAMGRKEKISCIRYLEEKGAFQISKSGERVCEVLKISKYTLYSYLDQIRNVK